MLPLCWLLHCLLAARNPLKLLHLLLHLLLNLQPLLLLLLLLNLQPLLPLLLPTKRSKATEV